MSLHFELKISGHDLGFVEIRRLDPLDLTAPDVADAVSTYEVQRDFERVGTVRHRYGDKAYKLVSLATALIAEESA